MVKAVNVEKKEDGPRTVFLKMAVGKNVRIGVNEIEVHKRVQIKVVPRNSRPLMGVFLYMRRMFYV